MWCTWYISSEEKNANNNIRLLAPQNITQNLSIYIVYHQDWSIVFFFFFVMHGEKEMLNH